MQLKLSTGLGLFMPAIVSAGSEGDISPDTTAGATVLKPEILREPETRPGGACLISFRHALPEGDNRMPSRR